MKKQSQSVDILLVNANKSDLKFLSDLLTKSGYHVHQAGAFELAFQIIHDKQPDMILLDVKLPGMSGIDFCRQLKDDPLTKDLPIIFVCSIVDSKLKVEALEAGCVDFLTKPFDQSEVLARVKIHVNISQQQSELKAQAEECIAEINRCKQTEEKLNIREALLKEIQRISKVGGWQYLDENKQMIWTNETYHIHEIPVNSEVDLISESLKCYRPEDRPIIMNAFERVMEEGESYDLEFPLNTFKNRQIWIRTTAQPIKQEGKVVGVLGIFMDITDRRLAEGELRRYERIVSSSTDMLALIDKQYKFLAANIKYTEAFKLEPEQLIGKTVTKVIGEEFFKTVIKPKADRCLGGEEVMYKEWVNFPAFGRCYMEISYSPYINEDDEIIGFLVNERNITKKKEAEVALLKSEEKYRLLATNTLDIIWTTDLEFNTTYCSDAIFDFLGYKPEEFLGMNASVFILPEYLPVLIMKSEELIDHYKKGKIHKIVVEIQQIKKDGAVIDVELSFNLLLDSEKQVVGFQGRSTNITEPKKTAEDLLLSEERYKGIIESTASGIAVYKAIDKGQDFVFSYFNPMAEKIDQISKEKVIGKKVTEIFPGVKEFGLFKIFQNVWKTGKSKRFPVSVYKDNGLERYRENYVYKLSTGEIVAVYQDLTDQKQAEKELVEYKGHLEELVEKRTQELEDKNKELDNAIKVFVGRELTINNLQKKIKKLQGMENNT